MLLPGGFSYGDALGAGARMALDMQVYFHEELHSFVRKRQTRPWHLQRFPVLASKPPLLVKLRRIMN